MLLEIDDIHVTFSNKEGIFKSSKKHILKGVSFHVEEGECLGIIGESGSGKSTLGRAILGIEKIENGTIKFNGNSNRKNWQSNLDVVFQDYTTSVNPRFTVFDTISEGLRKFNLSKEDLRKRIVELLNQVGLNEEHIYRYPHELSGGQLQRVCIARAIGRNPKFILLDEAISSLDVSVQVQILDLLIDLKKKYKLSYLFITHDLTTITYICDRVIFFKDGNIVERVDDIDRLKEVKDDYSKALLDAALYTDILY
ncbi:dipeptide/oligopeptide/nickel ABC transporter ATP-binding protein [uncultured Clostridium sp.]|uniref:ABC transporter ATP-binding protein n=1 Tax=uncultured Clostridium sp. TaxID=59620 RepID=UPI0025E1F51D|nr:dipeptide/oligopeptide/nickel ABC transporter ATP-binding protein [uncultured Clostridium sp.]